MNQTENSIGSSCPKCGHSNGADARFCGNCGFSLAVEAPPAPPPNHSSASFGGFSSMSGVEFDAQASCQMSAQAAFDAVLSAIPRVEGQVLGAEAPSAVMASLQHRDASTFWVRIRYRTRVWILSQSSAQSTVQVKMQPDWGSALPTFMAIVGGTVLLVVLQRAQGNSGILMLLLGAMSLAYAAYGIARQCPAKAGRNLIDAALGGRFSAGAQASSPPETSAFGSPAGAGGRGAAQKPGPERGWTATPEQRAGRAQASAAQPRGFAGSYAPKGDADGGYFGAAARAQRIGQMGAVFGQLREAFGGAKSAPQEALTPLEQIAQLGRLRDQGVITGAEFEEKKAALLKRL